MKSFLKDDNRQKSGTIILYPDKKPGRLYHLYFIDKLIKVEPSLFAHQYFFFILIIESQFIYIPISKDIFLMKNFNTKSTNVRVIPYDP